MKLNFIMIICSAVINLHMIQLHAQSPADDENWELLYHETFRNTDDWELTDGIYARPYNCNLVHSFKYSYIKLSAKEEFNQTGNWISTSNITWRKLSQFAYYEAEIRFSGLEGFKEAWCIWNCGRNHQHLENEYDVIEFITAIHNKFPTNIHDYNHNGNCNSGNWCNQETIETFDLTNQWLTLGFERAKNFITWYLNDEPIRYLYDPLHLTEEFIGMEFGKSKWFNIPDDPSILDVYPSMDIRNVKVYGLKQRLNNVTTIDFSTYQPNLEQSYSIGNSIVPVNSTITLRATDYIQLNNGFEVPLGSDFTLFVDEGWITPCSVINNNNM